MSNFAANDISTMEDLDPEPPPKGGFARRRELALGLLLLAGVLGWAGWSWWQQNLLASNYAAGLQAESLKHYDQALKAFQQAAGYRDADIHASNDSQFILLRNGYYSAAVVDGEQQEWIAALNQLQSVRRVQPDYLNTPDLYSQTESHVYAGAVQGAVAMRTEANPVGLYYRTSSQWVYLESSDRFSEVRSGGSTDAVVYDVSGPGGQMGSTPQSQAGDGGTAQASPKLVGRKLKVAHFLGDTVTIGDLSLDPADYSAYDLVPNGVVAFGKYVPNSQESKPVQHVIPYLQADYEPYTSTQTTTFIKTTDPRTGLLDYSRSLNKMLLASWSGISLRESDIDLTLATTDTNTDKVTFSDVYSLSGNIGSAQFSPDGKYIFLTTIQPSKSDSSINDYAAVLLPVDGEGSPTTFLTSTLPIQTAGSFFYEPSSIVGTFITQGPFKGMLLTSVVDSDTTTISLRDPASLDTPLISTTIKGYAEAQQVQLSEGGQELVISGVRGSLDFLDVNSMRPFVVTIIPGSQYAETDLPQNLNASITGAGLKSGFLLYTMSTYSPRNTTTTVSEANTLFSFLEIQLGQQGVQPKSLLATNALRDIGATDFNDWYLGKGSLCYVQAGGLYARTFDGASSTNLESGVPTLYDPGQYADTLLLR